MATMDVFRNSVFSTAQLTGAIESMDHVPDFLGSLNLFEPMPVRTQHIYVDRRDGNQVLIPVSEVGAPPPELENDSRDAVPLKIPELKKAFTLYAHEISDIRAHGSETELEQVQVEYARRLARIDNDMEMTYEHHRLAAIQGKLLDADGTTVIYDYATEFAEAIPAAVDFNLDTATTDVKGICHSVVRSMVRSARGAFTPSTQIHALVGDDFYDALISHPNVEKFYLNWQAAADLRDEGPFESFRFGKITWHNYRGTDDNSTVAVGVDAAHFFPVGARGVFAKALSPLQNTEWVNTLGREKYVLNVPDRDRQMFTKGELYSRPLHICQRPRVLRTGVRT